MPQPYARALAAILLAWTASGAQAGPALDTRTAEYQELPREVQLDGVVEAVHQTTVSAQVSGQVEEVFFDVDDYVEKGAIIVRLRDAEPLAQMTRSEAQRNEAQARLQEARENHARIKGVFAKKLVAESEMDRAQASLRAAQAQLEAAQAALEQAAEQYEYTRVRAPYSGIVTERHIQVGETAQLGQPLMAGISLERLRVVVQVPQSVIPKVRELGRARVISPLDDGESIEAARITVFPYADLASNTFRVRLDLPARASGFFPGMFVKTAFLTGTRQELLIPQQAVVYRSEVTAVYVVRADGRVSFRLVRIGRTADDGMVSVLAGLSPGEKVALDPITAGLARKQQDEVEPHDG